MITKLSYYFLFINLIGSSFQMACGQVMNYETKVIIDDDGKKITERTVLIQINNKGENWLSHIELRHDPKQIFSLDYAHLLDNNGNIIRKLKKKELITRSELSYQAFYQDDLITEFNLYWSQYPYRIKYSYRIEEDEYLYLAWWSPLYFTNVPTVEASLEIEMPANHSVRINSSENLVFNESVLGSKKKLTWRATLIKNKANDEIFSSPFENLMPTVKVVPSEFKYGVFGRSESWSSFGNWLDQLNKGTDQLTLQEKWTIEKLINGINNRNEIIKAIYYYLQDQTKYVNVAIDVGGLKSYPASYVCENKYGDCKALTTYMKAMLKSVGIESFYTIINAGEKNAEIDLKLPSQQFNHVVLMIPSESDTLWLENTSSVLPFNYLGTFTQNRYALIINGEKSRLVKTAELSIDDVLLERSYNFQVADNAVQVDLDLTLRGKEFEDFRYFISEKEEEKSNDMVSRQNGVEDFKLNNWNVVNFHRDCTFLRLKVEGISPSIIRQIGTSRVINPLRIALPDFEKPNERKMDVIINYPINKSDKSAFNLEKFKQNRIQIPNGINIKTEYGLYSAEHLMNGNDLVVVEKFVLFANKISIEKYKDFYEFIDSINTYKKKTAIIIK